MGIVTIFAALYLIVLVHELGHAVAMAQCGFRVDRIDIGVGPPLVRFQTTLFSRIAKLRQPHPTSIAVRMLLLGGGAALHLDDLTAVTAAPYRKQAWISGAGPYVNLLTALLFLCGTFVVTFPFGSDVQRGIGCVLAAVVVLAFVLSRRFICAYVFPAVSVAVVVLVVHAFAGTQDAVRGPIGIAQMGAQTNPGFMNALFSLSLGVGLLNLLPLFPFDGGRLFQAIIRKISPVASHAYVALSMVITLLFIINIMAGDILRLFR